MTTAKEFNDLLWATVESRKYEPDGDDPYAQQSVMEDLSWSRNDFILDGKPVERVFSKGGPESDRDYWFIVVRYDGTLFMGESWFDSYEFAELAQFYEAEEYVEPVTKYRRKKQ